MSKGVCLIIGANGFIGSHLVDSLVEEGYKVRAFDRYTHEPRFNESNSIDIVKASSFDAAVMDDALEGADYVFMSLSATTPYSSDKNPYMDITQNLLHNVEILDKAVKAGVKKIIFISSGGAIYGGTGETKVASEDDAPHPVSPYGINKLATEYYLGYFERKYGMKYVIYRLTNPYGPRQLSRNHQGVVSVFLENILEGKDLIIYGDGESSRDYIYICDAAKMIVKSFYKKNKHAIYNVGSGEQTSVNDIIETLESVTGKKTGVYHIDEPKTFLKKTMVNTTRFTEEFGLSPTTRLEKGLKMTSEFFIDHKQDQSPTIRSTREQV